MRSFAFAMTVVALTAAQTYAEDNLASKDTRITAEKLGLPKGNARTSEPFLARIYKTDDANNILDEQPDGYPFTMPEGYERKDHEKARVHAGVDLQSRPAPGEAPKALEFKAGVYGVVRRAGDGKVGMIAVEVWDGSVLEFLHTSASYKKVGDVVDPNTVLGMTGKKGATSIHLHVQAKNKDRKPISPDLVFRIGQGKLQTPAQPTEKWGDFDPEESSAFEPKFIGEKKIPLKQLPDKKWVVEVIGYAGRIDLVLGEFWSLDEATTCSSAWSHANPKDLRLTREREVKVDEGK